MTTAVHSRIPGAIIGVTAGLREGAAWGLGALLLVALPMLFRSDSSLAILSISGIAVVFALSYNILLGQTGMLSFGHAVFYGLGGFGTIHAMNLIADARLPIPLPVMPLIGGCIGLLSGALLGALASKRGGIVFAMVTFGLGEMVSAAAPILNRFFGGEQGVTTDRTALPHMLGLGFGPQLQIYYLIAAWCLLSAGAIRFIAGTAFGQIARAARENPERIEFIGYGMRRVRFTAFCLASFFAGIAGALTAINFEIMTVANLGAQQSTMVVLATYIGGLDFFVGPIIGAVLVSVMQVSLSDVTGGWQLYLGLLFVLGVMYAPGGIAGLLLTSQPGERLRDRMAPRRLVLLAPLLAIAAGGVLAIEMAYQLGLRSQDGTVRRLAGIPIDCASPFPWLVAAVLVVGGGAILRRAASRAHPGSTR